jgi:hypothetical protein
MPVSTLQSGSEGSLYVVLMFEPMVGVIDSVATDSYELAMSTADAMMASAYDYGDITSDAQIIVLREMQRDFVL